MKEVNGSNNGPSSEKRGDNLILKGLLPAIQGQNLAVTVLHAPHSRDSGTRDSLASNAAFPPDGRGLWGPLHVRKRTPYSGRDCVKSLWSPYTGVYPQRLPLPSADATPGDLSLGTLPLSEGHFSLGGLSLWGPSIAWIL